MRLCKHGKRPLLLKCKSFVTFLSPSLLKLVSVQRCDARRKRRDPPQEDKNKITGKAILNLFPGSKRGSTVMPTKC